MNSETEMFERRIYAVSGDTMAMLVGNQIYVRRGSASVFSDVVHEGTHVIDFLDGIDEKE